MHPYNLFWDLKYTHTMTISHETADQKVYVHFAQRTNMGGHRDSEVQKENIFAYYQHTYLIVSVMFPKWVNCLE